MRQIRSRDPAPSRVSYRIQRLWLTPLFRKILRFGVPALATFLAVTLWFRDDGRRDEFMAALEDMRRSVEERPEFMVNLMAIDGASESVAEEIRSVVRIDFPVSSFDLDLEEVRAQVETFDAVADADVIIRPGGVLHVAVVERQPAVIWRARDQILLLDAEGHRVGPIGSRTVRPELPLIAGQGAERAVPEALQLFTTATPISDRLRGLVRVGERRWDAVLDTGTRILLPEAGAVAALDRVIVLNEVKSLFDRDISVVDLRNPNRPTVRLSREAVENLQLIRKMSLGDTSR